VIIQEGLVLVANAVLAVAQNDQSLLLLSTISIDLFSKSTEEFVLAAKDVPLYKKLAS
jgi:hypothetical protein